MLENAREITIKGLLESFEISIRAYNVCDSLGLTTLRMVHDFILQKKDFTKARNCGKKTKEEILEIHKRFFIAPSEIETAVIETPIINKVDFSIDESFFNMAVHDQFEKLGVRAKNALLVYFENKIPDRSFIQNNFILRQFKPRKLRNIGSKTAEEIEQFVDGVVKLYYKTENNEVPQEEIDTVKFQEILGVKIIDPYYTECFSRKMLPVVSLVSKYIKVLLHLDDVDEMIFKSIPPTKYILFRSL